LAEPILGEGGIIVPPLTYFKAIKPILDAHGILFIADEVQTGFGRTGAMFAVEHYGVEPDIIVTAKGIADGFPLAAFTTRDDIAAAFRPGDHLSTFGGNPVSCAAAQANVRFIQRENLPQKARQDGEYVLARLRDMQQRFPIIGEVRGMGLMIGMELVSDNALTPAVAQAEAIRASCLEKGVLVGVGGVFGNVVRFQPPLVIARQQIDFALDALEASLEEISGAQQQKPHAVGAVP
jgi:4-aminobutyrate aminotransferase-like enzyme